MSIRESFPDEESLKKHLQENSYEYFKKVKEKAGHLETEYIKMSKQFSVGTFFIVMGAGIFYFFLIVSLENNFLDGNLPELILWIGLFALLAAIPVVYGWKKIAGTTAVIKSFKKIVSDALFLIIFDVFPLKVSRVHHSEPLLGLFSKYLKRNSNSFLTRDISLPFSSWRSRQRTPEHYQVLDLLSHSELITEKRNTVEIDDMFSIHMGGKELFVSELSAKHITYSNDSRNVKHIFSGYFVSFDLDKTFEGKTFLTTEGNTLGFGHRSLQSLTFGDTASTTELEWNDFEKLLHVATTDPVEARYILSPDFMTDVYDWWKVKHQKIRISFIDNRMYMLFPDKRIRFDGTIKEISEDKIVQYLEGACIPLLHVLHLVEDVKQQFNR